MLHVDKLESLQAEPIRIEADGLKGEQAYKFVLKMHHDNGTHAAYCIIKADRSGRIDLANDTPLRGTYHEPDAMGLFFSLQPTEDVPDDELPEFNNTPFIIHYSLELFDKNEILLDSVALKKHLLHPLVSKIDVVQDDQPFILFKPPGPGPFPCIILVPAAFTTQVSVWAPCLASEGFLVLTFLHEKIKKSPLLVLEVFEGPINYVKSLPYSSGKIGLFGASLGGTLCNYLALKHPEIQAVCSINGTDALSRVALVEEGGEGLYNQSELVKRKPEALNGVVKRANQFRDIEKEIPEIPMGWEKTPKGTAFRLVSSLSDWFVHALDLSYNIRNALINSENHVEIDPVPAGHLLNPPYLPYMPFFSYRSYRLGLGGECVLHAKCQESVWKKNVSFFRKFLGDPPKIPDWKRDEELVVSSKL